MNWENIKHSLTILWQGLLAIFVVIGLIILAVQIVSYCVKKAEDAKKARAENIENKNEDGEKSR